jgi:hypothetical protein
MATKERRICGKQPYPFKQRCHVYDEQLPVAVPA